jgi:hypothetical protein
MCQGGHGVGRQGAEGWPAVAAGSGVGGRGRRGRSRGRLVERHRTVPRRPTGEKLCGPAGLDQRGPPQRPLGRASQTVERTVEALRTGAVTADREAGVFESARVRVRSPHRTQHDARSLRSLGGIGRWGNAFFFAAFRGAGFGWRLPGFGWRGNVIMSSSCKQDDDNDDISPMSSDVII